MATINDLPVEILSEIFSYIEITERQRLEIVCKQWRSVIRLMWHTIRKLHFIMLPKRERLTYSIKSNLIADELNFASDKLSHLEKILQLFNGNLKKLFYKEATAHKLTEYPREIQKRIFELVQQNKCLTSMRINSLRGDIVSDYMNCIPTENLQHLSTDFSHHQCGKRWIDAIENVLMKTRSMKYLELHQISLSMIEIISRMDTLESLHLGTFESSSALSNSFSNITQLSNLESLSLWDCELINDNFLIQLAKSCKKLNTIDFENCKSVTQIGWNALETLPNLRYVDLLMISKDTDIFKFFSNLEEFYCYLSGRCVRNDAILEFLHRSPNLKKYQFHDDHVNDLFQNIATQAGFTVEDHHTSLHTASWNKIFRASS